MACYKPPGCTLKQQSWNNLIEALQSKGHFLSLGDFNANHYAWSSEKMDKAGIKFLKIIEDYDLFLHNMDTKSRICLPGQTNSNLDLVLSLTYVAHLISTKQFDDSHGSDHYPILIDVQNLKHIYKPKSNRISSGRTDWTNYQLIFDQNWEHFLSPAHTNKSMNERYSDFVSQMKNAVNSCTPLHRHQSYKKRLNPVPWWGMQQSSKAEKICFTEMETLPQLR